MAQKIIVENLLRLRYAAGTGLAGRGAEVSDGARTLAAERRHKPRNEERTANDIDKQTKGEPR